MSIFKKNTEDLDWTHVAVQISDIRLLNTLYGIYVQTSSDGSGVPVFVNRNIFEDRLNNYFLGKDYTRKDILGLKWNMYITKGFFIKLDSSGKIEQFDQDDKSRFFVSFLEIDGKLGTFSSVYRNGTTKNKL